MFRPDRGHWLRDQAATVRPDRGGGDLRAAVRNGATELERLFGVLAVVWGREGGREGGESESERERERE